MLIHLPDSLPDLAPIRTKPELLAQAEALKKQPGFEGALQQYTRGIVAFREATRPFGKLIANEDRFRVINFFFALWAEKLATVGSGALTYGDLYEVCRRGEVSHRVLKNTLALAMHLDFLTRRSNPADRRSWLYAPTQAMLRFPYQWLDPATRALDDLVPGQSLTGRLHTDKGLLVHFFRSAGREFDAGLQPARLLPKFMHFSGHKEGGTLLAMALLVAEMDQVALPSRLDVAVRFGLSRSQVTQLVATGVEMGFLTTQKGVAYPTEELRTGHADWVAIALAFLHHHLRPERS